MPDKDTKVKAADETLTLALVTPGVDAFDPSIEDVDTITHEGTKLAASKEKEVRAAAAASGLKLRKVS